MRMENYEKSNSNEQSKKGRRYLGVALAGAMVAGSPAHAQEDYDDDADFGAPSYYDFEVAPSPEVMGILDSLDKEIGPGLSITQEQANKIRAAVDDFVAHHPAHVRQTKTEAGANGKASSVTEPSYSPFLQLADALVRGHNVNPLIMGIMLGYIKDMEVAPKAPAQRQ